MSEPAATARPASPADLFAAFTRLALQGFGGVLPVTQRELVERRRWLTREAFLEQLSVAQVLPGPNIVNLAIMIGQRFFGWRGALAACSGVLLAPMVLVLVLAVLARRAEHLAPVSDALRGMGVVASGLIFSTAWRLSRALGRNAMGLPACLLLAGITTLAVGWLRWPLAWTVLALGAAGMALAWHRLGAAP